MTAAHSSLRFRQLAGECAAGAARAANLAEKMVLASQAIAWRRLAVRTAKAEELRRSARQFRSLVTRKDQLRERPRS
jgi:hypothetical protein